MKTPKKNERRFFPFVAIVLALIVVGCGSVKYEQIVLFDEVANEISEIDSLPVLKIQVDDIIRVDVSSRNPETIDAFKLPTETTGTIGEKALGVQQGYRVDESGKIYLPFIGEVLAQGKTITQLRQEIQDELRNYIQDAFVQVRFLTFRITIIGEVNNPNAYTIPNERLNILEAIGMAGDLTAYAKRDEILLIRERNITDEFQFVRMNIQKKDLFLSPNFYLQPNDIIYVAPVKAKKYATSGDFFQRYSSVLVPVVSLLTFFLGTAISNNGN